MLMKILRAALFRPWEMEGEDDEDAAEEFVVANFGAPDHYEFRVNDQEDRVAVWIPKQGQWIIFKDVVVIQSFRAVDPGTISDWTTYLEVEEVD